jgi:hypothetical protein
MSGHYKTRHNIQAVVGVLLLGALSDERACLQLVVQLHLSFARTVTLGPESCRNLGYNLLSHMRLTNLEVGIPQEQDIPVIPPGITFLFIPSYAEIHDYMDISCLNIYEYYISISHLQLLHSSI